MVEVLGDLAFVYETCRYVRSYELNNTRGAKSEAFSQFKLPAALGSVEKMVVDETKVVLLLRKASAGKSDVVILHHLRGVFCNSSSTTTVTSHSGAVKIKVGPSSYTPYDQKITVNVTDFDLAGDVLLVSYNQERKIPSLDTYRQISILSGQVRLFDLSAKDTQLLTYRGLEKEAKEVWRRTEVHEILQMVDEEAKKRCKVQAREAALYEDFYDEEESLRVQKKAEEIERRQKAKKNIQRGRQDKGKARDKERRR
jgi:hypothetical protein